MSRLLLLSGVTLFGLLSGLQSGYADKTCTAPGHQDCTITCKNGCIALYYEPDGPCKTKCSGDDDRAMGAKIKKGGASVSASELSASEVQALLRRRQIK